ncbi:hypothetical protein FE257_009389 [Aspergillus nanangensis]|uniref:Probable E3 ubiquitin ligase complex SCF subunit sconB n=1 Tax=Aspergillus nanangensis TaxID=2582783 RepID=A0AAD4GS19_ASPNN|nr:hypothetical protein FE257_009389 [Aspergillus nanangensis]
MAGENNKMASAAEAPPRLRAAAAPPDHLTAPSLATPFKLDEGYSDETKGQLERDLSDPPSNDVMTLPDWLLAHSETDRAELAYSLLRTLRHSTLNAIVDRVAPLLHMDFVLKLPPEITSEIFSYLDSRTLLTASLSSRSWRNRIFDSRLWRDLYIDEGWRVNIDAVRAFEDEHSNLNLASPQSRKSRLRHADTDDGEPKQKKRVPPTWLDSRDQGLLDEAQRVAGEADPEGDHLMSDASNQLPGSGDRNGSQSETSSVMKSNGNSPYTPRSSPISSPSASTILLRMPNGTAKINWLYLYRQRRRLEENWAKGRYTNFQLPHRSHMDECHLDYVYAIQFSGRWLVSGSRDRSLRVWDMHTQRLRYPPLMGHSQSVLCLQCDPSPEEDIVISGGGDKKVIVWRLSTGEKIQEIAPAHDDSVLNLRFDKRFLVTSSKDKLIKVWNRQLLLPTSKDYPQIHHGIGVTYPSYIVDTNQLPSPLLEAEIAANHIQTLAPYHLLMTLAGHGTAVNAIQMNENEIVSVSGDRLIKIWNLHNGTCKRTLIGHEKGIACVQSDGRRIVSGSNDNTVRIFDHASSAEVATLRGHKNLVRTVQAVFGDPPGAEETMRLEALAVDNRFFDAQRSGASVDLGPRAMRRAGHHQNTSGSRHPRDIKALGAQIPPGGGGSRWARIVSGSYDESVVIWKKDKKGQWVVSQKLSQRAAADSAATPTTNREARHRASAALARAAAAAAAAQGVDQNAPGQRRHQIHRTPSSRVFKVQFDARKIVCASEDPLIVGWDFAGPDEDLMEVSRFFTDV